MLSTPRALLLDFGGVIADGPEPPEWTSVLVETVQEMLAASGVAQLPAATVRAAFDRDAGAADRFWLQQAPTQPDHESFWGELLGDWPPAARAALVPHAALLSRRFIEARHAGTWELRTGMAELLADADRRGLPVAVVSNTLCGAPHREFLARAGVGHRFAAQFYSDEQGIRKPNPALARRAVDALGVAAAECWFVGDTLTRDVLVARRAGLGAAIVMRSLRVERPPHPVGVTPDAEVADPTELHALLAACWGEA